MKKALLLAFALSAGTAFGQYYYNPSVSPGNPGTANTSDDEFPVGGGLDAGWNEILSNSQATATWSPSQTIPFAFEFNGMAVTDYSVSSSGVLTFNSTPGTAPAYGSISALPNGGVPDMSVVLGGLEGSGTNDAIATRTFGSAGSQQHWVLFASYTPTGGTGWSYWSIVLEEGTNNIYIVDQRTNSSIGLTLGIQVDGTTAFPVMGSVDTQGANLPDRTDNYYYAFMPGTRPNEDMAGVDVQLAPYLVTGSAPFDITGDLVNFGANNVTSFDLNYSVNGGATVTDPISPGSLATFATYNYTSPTQWTPAAAGTYTIDVWATNINGNADGDMSNDVATITVQVIDDFTQRTPLYELFTSSTCPPCVQGNIDLEALFAANPGQYTSLKYQMSWPGSGDPYFTDEGGVRRTYYGVSGVPRLEIDGGFDGSPTGIQQATHDAAYARPAFVEIEGTYSVSGQTVNVNLDVEPLSDVAGSNMVLHIAIFEFETFQNVESNGETEFFHVMKKMLPDENGTAVASIVAGQTQNFSESFTFQGSYRLPNNAGDPINHGTEHSVEEFTDLGVVVWIQNDDDRDVLQSAYMQMAVGTEEYTNIAAAKLYPNPTADNATLMVNTVDAQQMTIEVFDLMGAKVMEYDYGTAPAGRQLYQLDTQDLSNGIYLVRVTSGTSVQDRKLIVQH